VTVGVFITALYSFRLLFMTFHGRERMDEHTREHLHESPWVVTLPLVLLAIPSVAIGWMTIGQVGYGEYFGDAIRVAAQNDVLGELHHHYTGPVGFLLHAFAAPTIYLALAGAVAAWFLYLKRPDIPETLHAKFRGAYGVLDNKYYFDWFNEHVIAAGARAFGRIFWKGGDQLVIDGMLVNGSARTVGWAASVVRRVQSGYLYHYAFAMVIGLSALLAYLLIRT
jgi:NADH-quinone oxidoreductase subunit L